MCFVTTDYIPKRAEQDITVYKVLVRYEGLPTAWESLYIPYSWRRGDTKESADNERFKGIIKSCSFYKDSLTGGGFHSFSEEVDAQELRTFISMMQAPGSRKIFDVIRMIIPKSSLYLTNGGEYFSNKLYFPPIKS